MFFSIIIPVYNEEERIPENIGEIFGFFNRAKGRQAEIIFVNDGSTDKTQKVLEAFKEKYGFKIVSYGENRGKGYAVKRGAEIASGDWLIFFDIDLATPLSEFDNLLKFMNEEDDVIIGSRQLEKSRIEKRESKIREFLGKGFTKISNIFVPGITDFTCGFKCFSKKAAKEIFPVARIDRWGFDAELLYIAKLRGLKIRQMPVVWKHSENSRVKVVSAVFTSFWELVRMKINQLKGAYKK
jgi:glycosyltransferase involved in cell wall biosynthesis